MMKKRLLKKIDKYDIVSFDIFDTVVERDVQVPTDIFKRVAEKCLEKPDREIFLTERVRAEQTGRERHVEGEVNLDEIYEILETKYTSTQIEKLKSTEIQEELQACRQKDTMFCVYKYAVESGKRIYFISDMYLPTQILEQMLKKCGMESYEKLYVSNAYGVNKVSGKLFHLVGEENSLRTERWIHIGDSIKADYLGAKKQNIKTALVLRKNMFKRMISRWQQRFWKLT